MIFIRVQREIWREQSKDFICSLSFVSLGFFSNKVKRVWQFSKSIMIFKFSFFFFQEVTIYQKLKFYATTFLRTFQIVSVHSQWSRKEIIIKGIYEMCKKRDKWIALLFHIFLFLICLLTVLTWFQCKSRKGGFYNLKYLVQLRTTNSYPLPLMNNGNIYHRM